jgi:hypothetical protein
MGDHRLRGPSRPPRALDIYARLAENEIKTLVVEDK